MSRCWLLALVVALASCGAAANEPVSGAVSQVDRLYACVSADGHAVVRAYEPPCRQGQIVSWQVDP